MKKYLVPELLLVWSVGSNHDGIAVESALPTDARRGFAQPSAAVKECKCVR
jgi:hypothetical protein